MLERKLGDPNKHELIYMVWKECMPSEFYKYVCLEDNFVYLNGKSVLYPKLSEIIWKYTQKDEKNYKKLSNNLCYFKNILQYVYSNVYPEVHWVTESIDLKSMSQLVFKTYKDKKKIEQTGKNPQNYQVERRKSFKHEQKPIEIDIFNNEEKNEVKERVEKRKKKWQKVAEKIRP